MPYTIAIFPKFDENKQIQKIREQYDPSYNFIETHIALVYYFDKKPSKNKLFEISKSLNSFHIKLDFIKASPEGNFIFLDVAEGKEKILNLNEKLYQELGLKWDKPFPYEPHITLGNLNSKEERDDVFKKIKPFEFNISLEIDSFTLLEVSQDLKKIVHTIDFTFS